MPRTVCIPLPDRASTCPCVTPWLWPTSCSGPGARDITPARQLRRDRGEGHRPGRLSVLQRYLDGRRGDQAATVAFSHYLTQLFSNRNPVLVAGRNAGLLAMDLLPPLKTRLARQGMGLRG